MSDIRSKPLSKAAAHTKERRADADNFFPGLDKEPARHHLFIENTIDYLQVDSRNGLDADDARRITRPQPSFGKIAAFSMAVISQSRLGKILVFGATMMVGTLGVPYYGIQTRSESWALTLAFTTFVLFQFFNIFNARAGSGTLFNKRFFDNPMLWCSLAGVIALQVVALNWSATQSVFETAALSLNDWLIAFAVALSILFLEEGRKLVVQIMQHRRRTKTKRDSL